MHRRISMRRTIVETTGSSYFSKIVKTGSNIGQSYVTHLFWSDSVFFNTMPSNGLDIKRSFGALFCTDTWKF